MKHFILFLLASTVIFITNGSFGADPSGSQNLQPVDKWPEPVGGTSALMHHVAYPKTALKDGLEGKVLLSLVVDTLGIAQSVKVVESVRADLDGAATEAVKATKWIPAQKDGKAVAITIRVPVQFKLADKTRK